MEQRKWYHRFWFSFLRSNYITAVWNWFLGLAGKAAEAVLTASVVYSCARLLPQLHTPIQVDNIVFIAQMVALDIGGLSLRKLANQARKDGNEAGAKLASTVSIALISIMIANVALSVVQSITPISAQAVAVVEGLLLIARAVMAVIYAHVIHSLRVDIDQQTPLPPALAIPDYWPLVAMAAHLQSQFEMKLGEMASNQKTMQAEFQSINVSASTIDYDAVTQAVLTHLKADFDAWKQAQVDALPEASQPQLDAPKPASKRASKSQNDASKKILTLRQPSASTTDKKTVIHGLLAQDLSLTSYYLASQAHCSEATARRIKNEYIDAHSDASGDAPETIVLTPGALRHDA